MNMILFKRGAKGMMDYSMPSDLQYKDDLRKQRDNWYYVMSQLQNDPELMSNEHAKRAFERAKQEYDRIIESLQD